MCSGMVVSFLSILDIIVKDLDQRKSLKGHVGYQLKLNQRKRGIVFLGEDQIDLRLFLKIIVHR